MFMKKITKKLATLVWKRVENKREARSSLTSATFICDKGEDKFSR
jgi:hypothetical protein